MFISGETDAAVEVAQLFNIQEYGTSGRGPLDSALMSGSLDGVEKLLKDDPLLILRPVLTESHYPDRLEEHIPLDGFLANCLYSQAGGVKYGLITRHAQAPKDFISLPELIDKWVGTAYENYGSKADQLYWHEQFQRFKEVADTGRMPINTAIQALQLIVVDAVRNLNLKPNTSAELIFIKCNFPEHAPLLEENRILRERSDIEALRNDINREMDGILKTPKLLAQQSPSPHRNMKQRGELTEDEILAISRKMDDDVDEPIPVDLLASLTGNASQSLTTSQPEPSTTFPSDEMPLVDLCLKLTHRRQINSGFIKEQTEALGRAIIRSDIDHIQKALKLGADPNGFVGSKDRMLHRAVSLNSNNTQVIVDVLLTSGADPKLLDRSGKTAHEYTQNSIILEQLQAEALTPNKIRL